jgi:hypothetical protein
MPIRHEMKAKYPPPKEWKAIRERILERAGNACECRGECGLVHQPGPNPEDHDRCLAPNGKTIKRLVFANLATWCKHIACSLCLGGDLECKPVRVVLTTAHMDHDPTNNLDTNLRCFCQLCHLRYDSAEHAKNAAATRARKRDEASGQAPLFGKAGAR